MIDQVKFVITATGIFSTYFLVGLLQEEITKGSYKHSKKFEYAFVLVGVQFIWNFIVARVCLVIRKPKKKDETHFGLYMCAGLACCLAMVCSYTALQSPFSVPFAAQVVAKSAKPIPVMILGLIIGRKSYTNQRYCFVGLIVIGLVLTMFKDKKPNNNNEDTSFLIYGQILLMLSLFMDGVLGAVQERMRGVNKPNAFQMMLNINGWSSLFMLPLVIWQMFEFIPFANENPKIIALITVLTIAGSIGQIFIFTMISSFGSLACSIVTTLRKFFTTVYSGIQNNRFSAMNWFGVALVFAALIADIFFGNKKNSETASERECRENEKKLRDSEDSEDSEESEISTDKMFFV